MGLLIKILIQTLAVVIASYILPGVEVDSLLTAFVVAIVLGIVNLFIKPVLVLLTLPITIVTLGIFLIVLNGVLILLIDSIVPGFVVDGFWWAILFSLVVSLTSSFLNSLSN